MTLTSSIGDKNTNGFVLNVASVCVCDPIDTYVMTQCHTRVDREWKI